MGIFHLKEINLSHYYKENYS